MSEQKQYTIHELLEECYDVQMELDDVRESYEILVSDIELVVDEISEHLERISEHLKLVENNFFDYNHSLRENPFDDVSQDFPWD